MGVVGTKSFTNTDEHVTSMLYLISHLIYCEFIKITVAEIS